MNVADNEDDAREIRDILTDSGLDVATVRVASATALRAALRDGAWDMVFCAESGAGVDFHDVLRLVDPRATGIPVVLITDTLVVDDIAELMRSEIVDVVHRSRLKARLAGVVRREVGQGRRLRAIGARQSRIESVLGLFNETTHWRDALDASLAFLATAFRADVALVSERVAEPAMTLPVTSWATDRFRLYGERMKAHPPVIGRSLIDDVIARDRAVVIPRLQDRRADLSDLHADTIAAGLNAMISRPLRANGRHFVLSLLFAADSGLLDEVGTELATLTAVLQPVLMRKVVEDERAMLGNALEAARFGVLITEAAPLDAPGPRIVHLNQAACRITGHDRGALLGQSPRILQGPGTDAATLARIRGALDASEPVSAELINYRRDGTPFWSALDITPMRDQERERVTHFVAIQTDITERKKAEEDQRRREASFRLLFDSNPMPMWVYDVETLEFLEVNGAAVAHYGWSRDEFLARTVADVVPAGELPAARARIRTLHAARGVSSATHITASGERISVRSAAQGIDYAGRAANLSVIWDVTEAERARDELRRKNDSLAELTERLAARTAALADAARLARIGHWSMDFNPRRVDWSPEIVEILGHAPEVGESDETPVLACIHPDDRAAYRDSYRAMMRDGFERPHDFRIARPSGEVRVLRELIRPKLDAAGHLSGIAGVIRDITADVAARRERRRWADAVEHAGVGIRIVDAGTGSIVYANPAFAAQHGVLTSEVTGKHVLEFYPPAERDRVGQLQSGIEEAGHIVYEADRLRADGTVFPAMMAVTFVRPGDGSPPYHIGTSLDLTKLKSAEARAFQMQRLATLGQMAAGLAHELNQPLAVMGMAAESAMELIEAEAEPAAVAGKLRRIMQQVGRADAIISNVMMFGHRGGGTAVATRVEDAIDSALAVVQNRLRRGAITVDRARAPDSLEAMVPRVQLEQVLTNLLVNAADAYQGGGASGERVIRIATWREAGQVVLSVADAAGGIPDTVMARLFEPFFTTKQIGEGTGLGLSISYDIITGAGGSMSARNADGGAVFEIRLPATGRAAAPPAPSPADSPPRPSADPGA